MLCRHHPQCPGCPALGLPAQEQLEAKSQRLAHALSWFPHLPGAEEPRPALFQEGYRHRVKLPVGQGPEGARLGLYDAQHQVLHTPDCPVLEPRLRALLPPLAAWLRGRREVHAVDLRLSAATGRAQLVLATRQGVTPAGLAELRRALPALASLAISRADPEGKRVLGSRPQVAWGSPDLVEAVGPTSYRLLPGSFFQVDPRNALQLQELVDELVGPARSVLDLYAGVGAYARRLARRVERVVAVEEVPQAAEAARVDAPPNLTVISRRVEDLELNEPFDVVILNPARRGSDPASLARLSRWAQRLVYVSCGPETLARDLDILAAWGLRTKRLVPLDLFPQTFEIETVALLERGKARDRWTGPGGAAQGPWLGGASGALGRPREVIALLLGRLPARGSLAAGRWEVLAEVATHSLVRLSLRGPLTEALAQLSRRGHPPAGRAGPTQRFFAEKAGLVRSFVHVSRTERGAAPLHGDLALALLALGLPEDKVRRLSEVTA